MKVRVKVIIEQDAIINVPNYVKETAVDDYLSDTYCGFDTEEESDTSFDFKEIIILKKC